MANARRTSDAPRAVRTLAALFDQVPPQTGAEAEDELRSVGVDPEAVGRRCEQLARMMLDGSPAPRDTIRLVHGEAGTGRVGRRRLFAAAAAAIAVVAVTLSLPPLRGQLGSMASRFVGSPRISRQVTLPPLHMGDRAVPESGSVTGALGRARSRPETAAPPPDDALEPESRAVESAGVAPEVEPGDVVSEAIIDSHGAMLSPGLQWAVRHGLEIAVTHTQAVPIPAAYREATTRYAGEVRLNRATGALEHYVAGLPFPVIDPGDPNAALKIMWNHEYGPFASDDFIASDIVFETGNLWPIGDGLLLDRYVAERWQRLFYDGRLFVDPHPALPNPDGIRYREGLYPIIESTDLPGIGVVTIRYRDPQRADDTWIYLPHLRRVRRLPPAERGKALLGHDIDLDSLLGFSGKIASMSWRLVEHTTVLACMQADTAPVAPNAEPSGAVSCRGWEPRGVYVVEGHPTASSYDYGMRILYVDDETWLVLLSDLYDRRPALSKVAINLFGVRRDGPVQQGMLVQRGALMLDVQLQTATRMSAPAERWSINMGAVAGESLTIQAMLDAMAP